MMTELRDATILLVDDKEANLDLLEAMLIDAHYPPPIRVADSRQALARFEEAEPDLVILDLHMPHLDGYEILGRLRERIPTDEYRPILVLTADVTEDAKQRALTDGARDFLSKPLDPVEVELRVRNLLETRLLHLAQQRARERAEWLASVSRLLTHSLDRRTTLSTFAQSVLPRLADLCWVDLMEREDRLTFLCLAGLPEGGEDDGGDEGLLDPRHPWVRETFAGGSLAPTSLEWDPALCGSGPRHGQVAALRPATILAVPLAAGEAPIGVAYLLRKEARHPAPQDVELAGELASRAAQAVVNAHLYQQAQDATRARDEVLAVVAHDLRNPLSTIRLATDLLLDGPVEPEQQRTLDMISRSTNWMNKLIQDLLDVVRVESGVFQLQCQPEEVKSVLEELCDLMEPLAASSRITLVRSFSGALPRALLDRKRVLQVLSNLVGNAIKFTPSGGRIVLSAERSGDFVRFSVADTGPGIPPEQLPHIFGRFWQAQRADHRGIGLGLPLARELVEQHGGEIWAESAPAGGTVFHFTLPCEELSERSPDASEQPQSAT